MDRECMNPNTNEWYEYNDASVGMIKKPVGSSASAYLLFFRQRQESSITL